MLDLTIHMWLMALAFFILGYWARGFLNPSQSIDANAQNAIEVAATRTRLQRCDAERIRLNARVAEIEPKLETVQTRLEAARNRVAELEAGAARAEPSDSPTLKDRVKEMERELAAAREQASEARAARDLRRQLEAAQAEITVLRQAAGAAGERAMPARRSGERPVGGTPVEMTTLLDAPVHGAPDDLKQIKGVGPKLEEKLNAMGVYYLRQIAEWTDDHVAEMDGKLPLPGRISRDKWVEQARVLSNVN